MENAKLIQWNRNLEKRYAQLRDQEKWNRSEQNELRMLMVMRDYYFSEKIASDLSVAELYRKAEFDRAMKEVGVKEFKGFEKPEK